MTELKPCPFCDNTEITFWKKYSVLCDGCGLETYVFDSEEELISYWNSRPISKDRELLIELSLPDYSDERLEADFDMAMNNEFYRIGDRLIRAKRIRKHLEENQL